MKLDQSRTALVTGTFVAFVHAVWSLMVFLGFAKLYLDWIFGLHFLSNPFALRVFNLWTAITLVAFTFLVGYAFGYVFAAIWNKLHKK